jgi:hypothetical protein
MGTLMLEIALGLIGLLFLCALAALFFETL